MKIFAISYFLLICTHIYGQSNLCSGSVKSKKDNKPIEFVSIGVVGKEAGTVSDKDGSYSLIIDSEFDKDSLRFSCIGYLPYTKEVAEYKLLQNKDIYLEPKEFLLSEVIVDRQKLREKILGNKYKRGTFRGGFRENNKGFECGVLLKIKKKTHLQQLVCNIAECTYDSIKYRVNVYQMMGDNDFVNILDQPIYITQKTNEKSLSLAVDLSPYHIVVEKNTLITLEHIADMGLGHFLFVGSPFKGATCYYRKKSHSKWDKTPLKLSFSVKVMEEF